MDWVDGTDLARLLRDRGRPGLAPSSVLRWLADAAPRRSRTCTRRTRRSSTATSSRPTSSSPRAAGSCSSTSACRRRRTSPRRRTAARRASRPRARRRRRARRGRATSTRWPRPRSRCSPGAAPDRRPPRRGTGSTPQQAAQLEEAIRLGLATDPARRPADAGRAGRAAARGLGGRAADRRAHVLPHRHRRLDGDVGRAPGTMAQALVRHDELIAEAVERHGGRFLESMGEGDSTVSVFDSARRRSRPPSPPTRALAPSSGRRRSRIAVALAACTPARRERRETDYFGPTLNIAARLRGLADGGQVFLSVGHRRARRRAPARRLLSSVDLGPPPAAWASASRSAVSRARAAPASALPRPRPSARTPACSRSRPDDRTSSSAAKRSSPTCIRAPRARSAARRRRRVGQREVVAAARRPGGGGALR